MFTDFAGLFLILSKVTIKGRRKYMSDDKIDISTKEQDLVSAINFTKTQQWNMANYSLLMQEWSYKL